MACKQWISGWCVGVAALATVASWGLVSPRSLASSVVSAGDGTGTTVTINGNTYDITGGSLSGDGANLFHSFAQFGLDAGQIANFLSNPAIRNILGRVVGGDPSIINGLLQITGGNSNFYLMNPAGIIFGPSASLNVQGDFFATTATTIQLTDGGRFDALGTMDYGTLTGDPSLFIFDPMQPGAIINMADLSVGAGQSLGLMGGTVDSQGGLTAGHLLVSSLGRGAVRISQPGSLLSLEIVPLRNTPGHLAEISPLDLPALLTGGSSVGATSAANAGDVLVSEVDAGTATLWAQGDLRLVESEVVTTGDMLLRARNQVIAHDSVATPLVINAGGNLRVEGRTGIDILAVNHLPLRAFQSGGDMRLISNNNEVISTDAHFDVGGNFSIMQRSAVLVSPADFVSQHAPIFNVGGDYYVGSYTGPSLQVTAGGDIRHENITITAIDQLVHPTNPAVIFDAGGAIRGNNPGRIESTIPELILDFNAVGKIELPQTIITNGGDVRMTTLFTVGGINGVSLDTSSQSGKGGDIYLSTGPYFGSAHGGSSIFRDINTSSLAGDGGNLVVVGTLQGLSAGPSRTINTSSQAENAGNINVSGQINSLLIDTSSQAGNAGNILAGSGIQPISSTVRTSINASSDLGNGGNISSTGRFHTHTVTTSSKHGRSGDVDIAFGGANQSIIIQELNTSSEFGTGGNVTMSGYSIRLGDGGIRTSGAIASGDIFLASQWSINAFEGTTGATLDTSSKTSDGGNVTINTGTSVDFTEVGSIRLADVITTGRNNGGNIFIGSERVSIDTTLGVLNASGGNNGGDVRLVSRSDIKTGDIITFVSGFTGDSGNVHIETTQSGNLDTSAGTIVTASGNGAGGDVTLRSKRNLTVGEIFTGALSSTQPGGEIEIISVIDPTRAWDNSYQIRLNSNIETNQNNISIQAPNRNIVLQNDAVIASTGSGDIEIVGMINGPYNLLLDSGSGSIQLQNFIGNTTPLNSLRATGNITTTNPLGVQLSTTNNLQTQGIAAPGGIRLTSANGQIATGLLTTANPDDAGHVTLSAPGSIRTGAIDSRSTNGIGGNVDISTTGFFQATSTLEGTGDSIATTGGNNGGTAIIRHGGSGIVPFIVGDATVNGTQGRITRGNSDPISSINPTSSYLHTHTQDGDRLQIISLPGLGLTTTNPPIIQPANTLTTNPLNLGSTPVESLALLVGKLIGAETVISGDAQNNLAVEWQISDEPILNVNLPIPSGFTAPDVPLLSLNQFEFLSLTNPDALVSTIDQLLTDQYEDYFGEESADGKITAQSLRETLQTIERDTGKRAVILYALNHGDHLQLVLVRPEGPPIPRTVALPNSNALNETLTQFQNTLTSKRPNLRNQYRQPAQQLYDWLLRPYQAELEELDPDTLVFSMDAGLRVLPLAALHDGKQFLIEQYSLGSVPSMNLTNTRYRSLQNTNVLAMGVSEFATLPPLPAVPTELDTITKRRWQGSAHLNSAFTLDNLKQEGRGGGYSIIHLATHADFQPGDASQSYIHLWNEKLQLPDLRQLGWHQEAIPIELLVLSACRTAIGDRNAELGFAGLAVQAGVKSALASLWSVADDGTLALMSEFYRALGNPEVTIKAEALRQAQLSMLRGDLQVKNGHMGDIELPPELQGLTSIDLTHPYYWSAFMLVGSPW